MSGSDCFLRVLAGERGSGGRVWAGCHRRSAQASVASLGLPTSSMGLPTVPDGGCSLHPWWALLEPGLLVWDITAVGAAQNKWGDRAMQAFKHAPFCVLRVRYAFKAWEGRAESCGNDFQTA